MGQAEGVRAVGPLKRILGRAGLTEEEPEQTLKARKEQAPHPPTHTQMARGRAPGRGPAQAQTGQGVNQDHGVRERTGAEPGRAWGMWS